jgi:hypothetical protein
MELEERVQVVGVRVQNFKQNKQTKHSKYDGHR